jgi:hypothetical protein
MAHACLSPLPQAELDNGAAIAALRRFSDLLANLPADSWGEGQLPPLAGPETTTCCRLWPVYLAMPTHPARCRPVAHPLQRLGCGP